MARSEGCGTVQCQRWTRGRQTTPWQQKPQRDHGLQIIPKSSVLPRIVQTLRTSCFLLAPAWPGASAASAENLLPPAKGQTALAAESAHEPPPNMFWSYFSSQRKTSEIPLEKAEVTRGWLTCTKHLTRPFPLPWERMWDETTRAHTTELLSRSNQHPNVFSHEIQPNPSKSSRYCKYKI